MSMLSVQADFVFDLLHKRWEKSSGAKMVTTRTVIISQVKSAHSSLPRAQLHNHVASLRHVVVSMKWLIHRANRPCSIAQLISNQAINNQDV